MIQFNFKLTARDMLLQLQKRKLSIANCLCGGLMALTFAACSDDFYNESGTSSDSEELVDPVYLVFKVAGTDSEKPRTRADRTDGAEDFVVDGKTFNDGIEKEREISPGDNHVIIFFDEYRNYVAHSITKLALNKEDSKEGDFNTYPVVFAVEKEKLAKLANPSAEGSYEMIGSFLVLVNADRTNIDDVITAAKQNDGKYGLDNAIQAAGKPVILNADQNMTVSNGGEDYFTMSSSIVYVGTGTQRNFRGAMLENGLYEMDMENHVLTDNKVSNRDKGDGKIKFYVKESDAKADPLTLYVERTCSKYTIEFPGEKFLTSDNHLTYSSADGLYGMDKINVCTGYVAGQKSAAVFEEADWSVNFIGWGMNGVAKQEYVFKSLNFENLDKYYSGWRTDTDVDLNHKRNFWGEGAFYTSVNRPYQYRDAWDALVDKDGNQVAVDPVESYIDPTTDYDLNYYKFDVLSGRTLSNYTPEHTFDPSRVFNYESSLLTGSNRTKYSIETKDYLRASTHVIVTAQMLIDQEGWDDNANSYEATGKANNAINKYYMNGMFWREKDYLNYIAEFLGRKLVAESSYTNVVYYNNGYKLANGWKPSEYFNAIPEKEGISTFYVKEGDKYIALTDSEGLSQYTHKHNEQDRAEHEIDASCYFELTAANIKGGDGWVMPMPSSVSGDKTNLYVKYDANADQGPGHEVKETYRQLTLEEYYVLLFNNMDYMARCYTEGMMYYPVAIKHNLSNGVDITSNAYTMNVGDFGSVRNHWYYITVENINSAGCPVQNPNQEIIPNPDPAIPGLEVDVEIIDWHLITIDADI